MARLSAAARLCASYVVYMKQTGDMTDKSILELAGGAIRQRDKIKSFNHADALKKGEFLHMHRELVGPGGMFGQLFALPEDFIDPFSLKSKTVEQYFRDLVALKIGIDTVHQRGFNEKCRGRDLWIELARDRLGTA